MLRWLGRRMKCFLFGHRYTRERVYWAVSKSMEDGYRCTRCDKTCVFRGLWDEVVENDD